MLAPCRIGPLRRQAGLRLGAKARHRHKPPHTSSPRQTVESVITQSDNWGLAERAGREMGGKCWRDKGVNVSPGLDGSDRS
jgi:hypothetical protein